VLLGDADRELLFEKLKRHAAEGRLEVEELERRVAMVELARTREAAAAAMADLPPLADLTPTADQTRRRGRGRSRSGGRGRGHGDADAPAADWQPTNERFRDPRSNRVMRVWVDPAAGRHYIAEDPS